MHTFSPRGMGVRMNSFSTSWVVLRFKDPLYAPPSSMAISRCVLDAAGSRSSSTLNVSAFVLVLEATVNNEESGVEVSKFAAQDSDESGWVDAGQI